jgi:hypothetical protein
MLWRWAEPFNCLWLPKLFNLRMDPYEPADITSLQRALVALSLGAVLAGPALGQVSRYDELANLPFQNGFLSVEGIATLKDELVFQRAVQSYIWALPALNMYDMKEGLEKVFGKGYNVLPILRSG